MSVRVKRQKGLTLMEMLVSLAILAILAGIAMPFAKIAVTRQKEVELRKSLREIRSAIDRFHEDWREGKISKFFEGVSERGYPLGLEVLVEGAERGDAQGTRIRYLRRIPKDPFADPALSAREHWEILPYEQKRFATFFEKGDLYDIRSKSERKGIDGSFYDQW